MSKVKFQLSMRRWMGLFVAWERCRRSCLRFNPKRRRQRRGKPPTTQEGRRGYGERSEEVGVLNLKGECGKLLKAASRDLGEIDPPLELRIDCILVFSFHIFDYCNKNYCFSGFHWSLEECKTNVGDYFFVFGLEKNECVNQRKWHQQATRRLLVMGRHSEGLQPIKHQVCPGDSFMPNSVSKYISVPSLVKYTASLGLGFLALAGSRDLGEIDPPLELRIDCILVFSVRIFDYCNKITVFLVFIGVWKSFLACLLQKHLNLSVDKANIATTLSKNQKNKDTKKLHQKYSYSVGLLSKKKKRNISKEKMLKKKNK
ncbi:hypothetical protein M5K25_026275 [Dendrobium thyrsiflorum]|uniref:Uncharacterized protein n=1 Tax=Dendrobium thyrsiflorum TaxID=117978 RepID=A0ABD0TX07_DENTH